MPEVSPASRSAAPPGRAKLSTPFPTAIMRAARAPSVPLLSPRRRDSVIPPDRQVPAPSACTSDVATVTLQAGEAEAAGVQSAVSSAKIAQKNWGVGLVIRVFRSAQCRRGAIAAGAVSLVLCISCVASADVIDVHAD